MMADFEHIDDDIVQILHSATMLGIKFEITPPQELLEIQQHLFGGSHIPYKLFQLGSVIYEMKSPTMGELAKTMDLPHSTITRMVSWLVDNGYVARNIDEQDHRIVRVELTEKGIQSYSAVADYFAETIKQHLSVLTQEEQMILLTLLRKIISGIKQRNQADIISTEIK